MTRLMTPVKKQNKSDAKLLGIIERAKYFWESTFDAIINPVMIIDKHYRIERANLSIAKSAHQDVRNMVGKYCYESFAKRKSPCPLCPVKESLKSKKTAVTNLKSFDDGREFQAVSFPLKGNKKDLDLFVLQYRDIREESLLQAKLLQSDKMAAVGLLAGGVAHEINNPLGGILAFAQLGLQQCDSQSQLYDDLKEIEKSALRCKNIVQNLLDFSRQPSQREKQQVSIEQLFKNVAPLLLLKTKEHSIKLETHFEKNLPLIMAHTNQLEQVFLNLVSNACQASQARSTLHIFVKKAKENLVIYFEDEGSGISEEDLPKIFDPFFTTKKAGMGTGLGLSICYSIIQDHGGKIEVINKSNKGSIFSITLPIILSKKGGKV